MTWPVPWPAHSPDWDGYVQSITPDVVAQGDGLLYVQTLTRPFQLMDERAQAIYSASIALEDAAGGMLDLRGDFVGERRQGLPDDEYRRIIAGRLVAQEGGGSAPRVMAGWRALTEASEAHLYRLGSGSIYLTARVAHAPSEAWLHRAGAVVRALICADAQANATVYVGGSARYDAGALGYDVGTWAYDLIVMGA